MKKLIAVCAVLLFVAPAFAADWAFYGSQRVNTFFVNNDYGKVGPATTTNPTTNNPGSRFGVGQDGTGKNDDWGMQWDFQPGSRFGAKVKADKVSGQIEVGLNMANSNGGNQFNGTSYGDGYVSARRAYGVWKFSDTGSLKVGKDYTPVSNLISGKAFDDDGGLLGNGDFYGGRYGQVALQVGGFEIAFMTNPLRTDGFVTYPSGASQLGGTDIDWNVPKIEARYTLKLDKFEIAPFAGFNYFKIDKGNSTTVTDDLEVISYVLGLNFKGDIGAAYFTAQGAYGQNWRNARWAPGFNPASAQASSASLKDGDDVNDSTSWMVGGTVGLKFTDTVKFEVGGGYRNDDADVGGADDIGSWIAYGQVVLTLAPGVYLVPEVGYIDYMDTVASEELGYTWYAGMKWQIDF